MKPQVVLNQPHTILNSSLPYRHSGSSSPGEFGGKRKMKALPSGASQGPRSTTSQRGPEAPPRGRCKRRSRGLGGAFTTASDPHASATLLHTQQITTDSHKPQYTWKHKRSSNASSRGACSVCMMLHEPHRILGGSGSRHTLTPSPPPRKILHNKRTCHAYRL